jgi:hypothetical protein
LETTLLNNLGTDGFTLKLNGFGKFYVRHKPGIRRMIGFSGQTIQTKMTSDVRYPDVRYPRARQFRINRGQREPDNRG